MPDHFHVIVHPLPKKLNDGHDRSFITIPKNKSLSLIIGAFKAISIHLSGHTGFKWHRSFHDRIIRENELKIIRKDIKNFLYK